MYQITYQRSQASEILPNYWSISSLNGLGLYFHCFIPFESPLAAHDWGCAAPWLPETLRRGQGNCRRPQGGTEPAVSNGTTRFLRPTRGNANTPTPQAPAGPAASPPRTARTGTGLPGAPGPREGKGDTGRHKAGWSGRGEAGQGRGARPGKAAELRGHSRGGHFLTAASSVTAATRHVATGARACAERAGSAKRAEFAGGRGGGSGVPRVTPSPGATNRV